MKLRTLALAAAALALSFTQSPAQQQADELRLYGSNTVGAKLAPSLLIAFLEHKYPDTEIGDWVEQTETIDHKGEPKEVTWRYIDVAASDPEVPRRISVRPYGSGTSFKALLRGDADIGMSSRPIKSSEVLRLAELGDMTAPETENVIALDGVAVILHPSNPIDSLTMDQVAEIFSCEITDWSEVGGTPGPISVHARDENSGTWDTFKSVVLKARKKKLCPNAKRYYSNQEQSEDVQKDPSAIGQIGLAYIGGAKALNLSECGIAYGPSPFSVKTEEYPIARRLFMYAPERLKTPFTAAFLDYIQSEEGQAKVLSADSVGLSIEDSGSCKAKDHRLAQTRAAAIKAQRPATVGDYLKATEGAERLSVTFRYRTGASGQVVDNRALSDIKRLARFVGSTEIQDRDLLLFGFADSIGAYGANCRLAQARADAIAGMLRNAGVEVALAKGVCEEAPVACDDSSKGNAKNRRVEAWLR